MRAVALIDPESMARFLCVKAGARSASTNARIA